MKLRRGMKAPIRGKVERDAARHIAGGSIGNMPGAKSAANHQVRQDVADVKQPDAPGTARRATKWCDR